MVIDFLRKYQEELISEKIELKEDIDLLETKIKEETKFLNLLVSSNDNFLNVFTPRNTNEKNNEKAREIELILSQLQDEQSIKLDKMKFYDSRLQEVNALISGNAVRHIVTDQSNNSIDFKNNYDSISCNDNLELINKLSLIKSYIFQDPQRAIFEIDSIISSFEK